MAGIEDLVAEGAGLAREASARSRAVRGAAAAMAKAFSEAAPAVEAARLRALRAGDLVPDPPAEAGFAAAAASLADGGPGPDALIEAASRAEAAAAALAGAVSSVEADPVLEDAAGAAERLAAAVRAYLREVSELRRLEGPASGLAGRLGRPAG